MPARILVVGAGYFAGFHLQAWRELGCSVVGLVDLDFARAQSLAERFALQQTFDDAFLAMDRTQPTLVDVVLPPAAQASVVLAALQRNLPTICQKPFGVDLAQALLMTQAAAAAHTPLVVHENFRFAPWFRECRRLIDAGHFGRVHGISFRLRPGDGQGPSAYLDRQPYFQQMPRLLVRETAVHFIDTFRYLLGEVRAVSAWLRRLNPVIAGEDAGIIHLEFDEQRTGLFDGNRLNEHPADDQRRTMGEMWLEGEAGVMRLDGQARLWWMPQGRPEREHAYSGMQPGPFGGAVRALQAHVLAHLTEGAGTAKGSERSALENSAADYLPNLRVQAAVYQAHASGRRIQMAGFADPPAT